MTSNIFANTDSKKLEKTNGSVFCEHVDKPEKQYWEREGMLEERIESVIITGNRKSNSNSSSDSESDEYEGGISGIEELEDDYRYLRMIIMINH
jgi:hypothetical protein